MPSPHFIWSVWVYLPTLPRLLFTIVVFVAAYVVLSAITILLRLSTTTSPEALSALREKSDYLKQPITAAFYLFGFVFCFTLPFAFDDMGDSRKPGLLAISENLSAYFIFAANVFVVLLVLHLIQWFVSSRVRSSARRLRVGESE
jgi:hypothetical protein